MNKNMLGLLFSVILVAFFVYMAFFASPNKTISTLGSAVKNVCVDASDTYAVGTRHNPVKGVDMSRYVCNKDGTFHLR